MHRGSDEEHLMLETKYKDPSPPVGKSSTITCDQSVPEADEEGCRARFALPAKGYRLRELLKANSRVRKER